MAKKTFALEPGGPQRLVLSWGMFWKNFQATLDGKPLGTVTGGQKELKKGVEFPLPDGSTLHIQFVQSFMNAELRVMRNGVPLPGSASDPEQRVRSMAYLLYFLAGFNTLVGVVAMLINSEILESMELGLGSIIFGGLVAVLGFFTYRRSRVAMVLAILLYAADGLYTLATYGGSGRSPPTFGILFRIYIIYAMVQAVKAAGELSRQEERSTGLSPSP
ncbi:hypothetical protein [Cystobacter fuscus]|uniref:hypothetical protein n=1 Tax=Cystobacter fuscus TaxID=43 RepID=UPI002B29559D|nr:hypothetical protein F0U63_26260 [Cystobacter fuscus]